MKKMKWTLTTLAVSLLIMTFAAAAQATVLRAFVSSTGNDANLGVNCVQATPCKTFNVAIGAVTPGGELVALDTAGYGPITSINKAITIATVPGATAFVVAATGTAAFTVNGGVSDLVILRNINFNGSGAANTTGIQVNSGAKLTIDGCRFALLTNGVSASNPSGKTMIVNSTFDGNGTGILDTGSKVDAEFVTLINNGVALKADGDGGFQSNPPGGTGPTQLRIHRGLIYNNDTAFSMNNAGAAPVGQCNGANIFLRGDSDGVRIYNNTTWGVLVNSNHNGNCGATTVNLGGLSNQATP